MMVVDVGVVVVTSPCIMLSRVCGWSSYLCDARSMCRCSHTRMRGQLVSVFAWGSVFVSVFAFVCMVLALHAHMRVVCGQWLCV